MANRLLYTIFQQNFPAENVPFIFQLNPAYHFSHTFV